MTPRILKRFRVIEKLASKNQTPAQLALARRGVACYATFLIKIVLKNVVFPVLPLLKYRNISETGILRNDFSSNTANSP